MIEFIDKVQSNANRIKLTAVTGAENTYDYEKVGTVTTKGTLLNRATLMAIQGFQAMTTTFSGNKIIETNGLGQKKTTTFSTDGTTITEVFEGTTPITKTTTFNSDGSISEVISE